MLRLVRPLNLLFMVVIMGMMEKYVAEPVLREYISQPRLTWYELALLIAAVVLIAAGGYVINAYFDVKIDAINHPDSLIVTREVTKKEAMNLFIVLTALGVVAGLAAAFLTHSTTLALLFVCTPGMLWFYSASYKRQFLVGNIMIAFLAALTPMVIMLANRALLIQTYGKDSLLAIWLTNQLVLWIGGFSLFAFLTTWIREVVKDLEDQQGDRELECHTLPVKYGDVATKVVVTVLLLLTMGLLSWFCFCLLPGQFAWANMSSRFYLLLMVMGLCELALLWSAQLPSDYRHAQLLVKFWMAMGVLFAFCVPNLLVIG